MPSNTADSG